MWEQSLYPHDERTDLFLKVRSLTGYPARITVHAADSARPIRLSGLVERVVVTGMVIDLETPAPEIEPATPIHIEILAKQALVTCDTTLSSVDSAQRLSLHLPQSLEAVQRRRHIRVDVLQDASLHGDMYPAPVAIQVINLSAGGAAYSTPVPQELGAEVLIQMHGVGLAVAELPARVVRCTAVDAGLWVVGVAFQLLNPAQEAKLAQYVAKALNGE